jgi:hypothetical protein
VLKKNVFVVKLDENSQNYFEFVLNFILVLVSFLEVVAVQCQVKRGPLEFVQKTLERVVSCFLYFGVCVEQVENHALNLLEKLDDVADVLDRNFFRRLRPVVSLVFGRVVELESDFDYEVQ